MRRSRHLAALLILLCSTPAMAAEPEMEPIESFVQQNANSKNGGVEVYVGLRCYSLFAIMSYYTGTNNMSDASKKFDETSSIYLEMAAKSQNPKNPAYLVGQAKIMIESYTDRFLKAKARTGNFSDDPVIAKDMKFCSDLTKGE